MMSTDWHAVLEQKLSEIFTDDEARRTARSVLGPVLADVESGRVAVACLKLAGGDLTRLKECVVAASTDYRDILAWAESPRQMRLGPAASQSEQVLARREDALAYTSWLTGPE